MHTEQWKQWQLWFCVFFCCCLRPDTRLRLRSKAWTLFHTHENWILLQWFWKLLSTQKMEKCNVCTAKIHFYACIQAGAERGKTKKKKTSKRMKCVSVDFVFYLHEILARRTMAVNHLGFCYFLPIHFRQLLLSRVHTFVPGTADARRAAESRVLSHFRLDHSSSLRLCMKWRVFALNAVPYYYSKNSRAANRRIECIARNEIAGLAQPTSGRLKGSKVKKK